ncbi:MAG: hypothetical protein GX287_06425 [Fusobacteria bacterium]|nr:hypothetical protein [Fusobacteriota bacterium]
MISLEKYLKTGLIVSIILINIGCKKIPKNNEVTQIKIENTVSEVIIEKTENITTKSDEVVYKELLDDKISHNKNVLNEIDYYNYDENFFIENIIEPNKIIMNKSEIINFNKKNILDNDFMYNISEFFDFLKGEEINKRILTVSTPSKYNRYKKNGLIMSEDDYKILHENLNLKTNINDDYPIKFGICVNRTIMKSYPTDIQISVLPGDIAYDRFTESAIYPNESMAILNESTDNNWYFVQVFHSAGWVKKEDIGLCKKDIIIDSEKNENFAIVTDKMINIVYYDNNLGEINNISYDMGVKIKIKDVDNKSDYILGYLPFKDEKNNLIYKKLNLERKSLNIGYLPYTKENLIKQSFKFLGEYYGWGGLNNSRDCSAFLQDIYRTFGIQIPRNSSQQGKYSIGKTLNFIEQDDFNSKYTMLKDMEMGAGIYIPGHVMMYLGEYNGKHYVIHTFTGYYRDNKYVDVMKGAITTLDIKSKDGKTYLEKVYAVKEFIYK